MSDAILFWNNVALDAVARDHTGKEITNPDESKTFIPPVGEQGGPTRTSRALAIVHLAMYDAFNSIAKLFTPYMPNLPNAPSGTSLEAAIGAAAYLTLTELYQSQSANFQTGYEFFLNSISDTSEAIEKGQGFGRMVARILLQSRANDGSDNSPLYFPSKEPKRFRPDQLHPMQGIVTPHWGRVTTFAIGLVSNYLAPSPPALNSGTYSSAFNQVKEKGALDNNTRTDEETTIGIFWGYDGTQKLGTPPRLYNQIVRVIATQKDNDLAKNARLFALVNMALADAGIQCWHSKYFHDFWRPVTAIREADEGYGPTGKGDENSDTKGDPFWLPLGAPNTNSRHGEDNFTPGFPAYPSGHATFGSASLDMVRLFYEGEDVEFDFVSDEFNGESKDIDGSVRTKHKRRLTISKAIDENAMSRIYLGIHWNFDATVGVNSGKRIADFIYKNFCKEI